MKKLLAISAILLSSLLLLNCTKEEPMPCNGCVATSFTSGFKTNLVGKWRFYKIAWFYQNGTFKEFKDTIDLGDTYEIEIRENGTIDYYKNDILSISKKVEVGFENESSGGDHLGVVTGYLDCIKTGDPAIYKFSSVLLNTDTLRVSYRPIVHTDESTGEYSGKGYYYRKH